MKIAVVVPHWNRSDLLRTLLGNLAEQTRPFDEIIIADNGSTDDSAEVARRAGVRLLELGSNLGFATAVNRGIATSTGDYVAILNNDVTLEPSWLALMETAIRDQSFAVGRILSASDASRIDATFDEISRGGASYRCGSGKPDGPMWDNPRAIRIAPMTAALFRRDLFVELGPLDEGFGSYLEDADFGLRCALSGKRGVYVPKAIAYHRGSATSGAWHKNTVRLIARNQSLLTAKYFKDQPRWPILAGQLLWGLVALRHGRGIAWLRGKWEGWKAVRVVEPQAIPADRITAFLQESEREIFAIQEQTGFDWYWRAYFWLAGR